MSNPEQGTDDWLHQRANHISGSRIGAILGHSPWQTREDVMREFIKYHQTGELKKVTNVAMQWGIDHEPDCISDFEATTGALVDELGFIEHDDYPFIGVSPDGITDSQELFEGKCPYSGKIPDEVPAHYYDQVQLSMEVLDLPVTKLHYWTPDSFRTFTIDRDPEWWSATLPIIVEFMNEFESRKDEEIVESKSITDTEAVETAVELELLMVEVKEKTERMNKLKKMLEPYADQKLPSYVGHLSILPVVRKGGTDWKKVQQDYEIDVAKYEKPSATYFKWSIRND